MTDLALTAGVAVIGEGRGAGMSYMQPANWLHNLRHAFLSPLAQGWHGTIKSSDVMVLHSTNPHVAILEGSYSLGFKWTIACDATSGCKPEIPDLSAQAGRNDPNLDDPTTPVVL